ncbi:MAG: beta-lactamase family protein [Chloroflexi bacterium]|nr:beta-lactamase family protein [Acidobacteriota bacterium]MCA1587950.1 beta-lactamase family protein [Chloroflexota bacterium]MCA1719571.1 beta-lactamase family protein [Actinomycetota bacterium]
MWWDEVVEQMADYQREHPKNLPGAVLAVETPRDGPLMTALGAGWSADAICTIGSMTKTFTATAVLLAMEDNGVLDVDLPVAEFPGMDAYTEDAMRGRIRVRHLLQHTSGMPVFVSREETPSLPCSGESACPSDVDLVGPTADWLGSPGDTNELVLADGVCRPARLATLDQVSEHVMRNYPLLHEPGTKYSYSSANHIVAGRLLQHLTGKPPNRYLKERLFEPIGMKDSFFVAQPNEEDDDGVTQEQRDRIADVSLITRDGEWPPEIAPGPDGSWDKCRRNWRFVYADGGMYTTAADLLAFLRAVRGGHEVLSPDVLKLMVTDHGFGHTMTFGYRGTTTPYGQGPGTLDHLGNIMTYFWYDPVKELLGVFLSQRLANAIVNNNMMDGLRAIFSGFVPLVSRGAG